MSTDATTSPQMRGDALVRAGQPLNGVGQPLAWWAAMIARMVRLHRPQSLPAPQASAICLDVVAPAATTSLTTWLVTPVHRQTNISSPVHSWPSTVMMWANLPTNRLG